MVKTALSARRADPGIDVPWTGVDLINVFNAWEKTEDAGRVFTVDADGTAETAVTGLAWRTQVCQQVFEEAAVDLGKGLTAWSDSPPQAGGTPSSGKRKGKRIGFPRFKKKTIAVASFRLRNKHPTGRPAAIRVGDGDRPRSVTLPGVGQIGVFDDTRRLRRMLAKSRAKILFATVTEHAGRWWVSLNVEAADLHLAGMLANHRLARSISDAGWAEFARQLRYKQAPPTSADGTALTSTLRVLVKPTRMTREPTFTPRQRPEPTTPEKGGANTQQSCSTRFREVTPPGGRLGATFFHPRKPGKQASDTT